MAKDLRSSLSTVSILLKRAKNSKTRNILLNYIISDILSRFFKGINIKKEYFLEMKDLNFWFLGGKSELSPYIEVCYDKLYEKEKNFIPKIGNTVFDIGGHIGMYTILAAKNVGAFGKIFTFEPNPETFARLSKNIKVNNLRNVFLFNVAVTFRKNLTALHLSEGSSQSTTIMDRGTSDRYTSDIMVKTLSLDETVEKFGLKKINLIKIDTEGAEVEVLTSGLTKALPITEKIIVETHSERLKKQVEEILKNTGFKNIFEEPSGKNSLGNNTLVYFSKQLFFY